MANKPLQTIKFPGLTDTYTVPQVDSNFVGTAGQVPDSKKVHDEIDSLKEDLSDAIKSGFVASEESRTWKQGSINGSTGQNSTNDKRIRTYTYLTGIFIKVTIPNNMKLYVHKYADAKYESYKGHYADWLTGEIWLNGNMYYRLVASYTDDSTITPDAGENIGLTFYKPDDTLTADGKVSDSKAVGDKFAVTMTYNKMLTSNDDLDEMTTIGIYRWTSSDKPQNSPSSTGGVLLVSGAPPYVVQLVITATGVMFTRYHGSSAWSDWISHDGKTLSYIRMLTSNDDLDEMTETGIYRWTSSDKPQNSPSSAGGVLQVSGASPYVVQLIITATGVMFTRYHGSSAWSDWILHDGKNKTPEYLSNSDSWGIANILANANKVMNIKWTPVGDMPKTLSTAVYPDPISYFSKIEHTGLPYSSVRDQDKAIGMDVSLRTFMTAVRDPKSVLYTRRSTVSNSSTYYGTVCSGLINVAMGIDLNLTNFYLSESDLFDTIPMQSIQRGDMIWTDGHCAMIAEVEKDNYGRIASVTVKEEWRPLPRTIKYNTWADFISEREGYIARRYKKADGVEYTYTPFVQSFDETEISITYPDVQSDHGDEAVFKVGEDVKVNVIDTADYTSIVVDRDGETVYTSTTIEPFTLVNVQAGLYTITAEGEENHSVSNFYVVDCNGSFDTETGIVTYSSTNATPVLVNVYDLPANRKITCKPIILTDADKSAGQINVSEYMDENYQYAKVTFMTPYGTAVWYSEDHQKWIPITA